MDTYLLEASKAAASVAWRLLELPKLAALDHPPEPQSHIEDLAEELARARKPIEDSASMWSVAVRPAGIIQIDGRTYESAHVAAVREAHRFLGLVQEERERRLQRRAFGVALINRGLGMNLNLPAWEAAKPVIADELDAQWCAEFRAVPDQIAAERTLVLMPTPTGGQGSRRQRSSSRRSRTTSPRSQSGRPRRHELDIELTCKWWDAQESHISWTDFCEKRRGTAESTLRSRRDRGEEYLELAQQHMGSGLANVEEFLTRAGKSLDKFLEPVRCAIAKLKEREKVRRQ